MVQGASKIDGPVLGEDVECALALEEMDAGENGPIQQPDIRIKHSSDSSISSNKHKNVIRR